MKRLEVFRCVPLGCWLGADACGARHEKRLPTCGTCAVGAAHALEQRPEAWPDGAPIARDVREVADPPPAPPPPPRRPREARPAPAPAPRRERVKREPKPPKPPKRAPRPAAEIEYEGRTVSLRELSRLTGLSRQTIAYRLRRGLSPTEAVALTGREGRHAPRRLWSYEGREVGISELARLAGVQISTMRHRLTTLEMSTEAAVALGRVLPRRSR